MSRSREARQEKKEAFLQQNPQLDPDQYRITSELRQDIYQIGSTENGEKTDFTTALYLLYPEVEALEVYGDGLSGVPDGPDFVLYASTNMDPSITNSITFSEAGIGVTDFFRENDLEPGEGFHTLEGEEVLVIYDPTEFTSVGFDFLIEGGSGLVVLSIYDDDSGTGVTTRVEEFSVGRSRRSDGQIGEVHRLETEIPEGFEFVLLSVDGSAEITVLGIDFSSSQGFVPDVA